MRQRDRKHAGQPHSCLAYLSFLLPSTQGFNGEKTNKPTRTKKKVLVGLDSTALYFKKYISRPWSSLELKLLREVGEKSLWSAIKLFFLWIKWMWWNSSVRERERKKRNPSFVWWPCHPHTDKCTHNTYIHSVKSWPCSLSAHVCTYTRSSGHSSHLHPLYFLKKPICLRQCEKTVANQTPALWKRQIKSSVYLRWALL